MDLPHHGAASAEERNQPLENLSLNKAFVAAGWFGGPILPLGRAGIPSHHRRAALQLCGARGAALPFFRDVSTKRVSTSEKTWKTLVEI